MLGAINGSPCELMISYDLGNILLIASNPTHEDHKLYILNSQIELNSKETNVSTFVEKVLKEYKNEKS